MQFLIECLKTEFLVLSRFIEDCFLPRLSIRRHIFSLKNSQVVTKSLKSFSRGKLLFKIAYVIFAILKSHDFFLWFFCDLVISSDFFVWFFSNFSVICDFGCFLYVIFLWFCDFSMWFFCDFKGGVRKKNQWIAPLSFWTSKEETRLPDSAATDS